MKRAYNGGCHSSAVRFECELYLAQNASRRNGPICAKSRCGNAIAKAGEFRLL